MTYYLSSSQGISGKTCLNACLPPCELGVFHVYLFETSQKQQAPLTPSTSVTIWDQQLCLAQSVLQMALGPSCSPHSPSHPVLLDPFLQAELPTSALPFLPSSWRRSPRSDGEQAGAGAQRPGAGGRISTGRSEAGIRTQQGLGFCSTCGQGELHGSCKALGGLSAHIYMRTVKLVEPYQAQVFRG